MYNSIGGAINDVTNPQKSWDQLLKSISGKKGAGF
jgi:hypothetical protein